MFGYGESVKTCFRQKKREESLVPFSCWGSCFIVWREADSGFWEYLSSEASQCNLDT